MTKKLSRRSLLKMGAALAATGALAWVPDQIKAEPEEDLLDTPFIPYHPENRSPEQWELLRATNPVEQPWGMYYLDPDNRPATLITWGVDGEEIITKYD